ncbi:ferredoxin [Streptomyces sp. NPDC005648]|uniref:ferredoxin n=1 Tax=Streptomyces sp. NPDC005648 TaxID=3157044 RepID=UPI0033B30075
MTGDRTLRIDRAACTGRGLCAELLPELIALDEWGYPVVGQPAVPPRLRAHARRAVAACPVLALRVDRSPRDEDRPAPPRPRPRQYGTDDADDADIGT